MTGLLTAEQLGEHLDQFQRRLFRLETLPAYAVDSDGDDFHRWLAGDFTVSERHQRWMDVLRRERAEGRVSARVRVFSEVLTDYELYSCLAYERNSAAGEEIRVLRVGEHGMAEATGNLGDFWLVDDHEALRMHYDERGEFVGAELLPPGHATSLRSIRDMAWETAEPFSQWWVRHPELHRKQAA